MTPVVHSKLQSAGTLPRPFYANPASHTHGPEESATMEHLVLRQERHATALRPQYSSLSVDRRVPALHEPLGSQATSQQLVREEAFLPRDHCCRAAASRDSETEASNPSACWFPSEWR